MKKFFALIAAVALTGSLQAQTLADYANAGDAAMAKENYQEAVDNYIKALELDKDNIDYMTAFQLGIAYQQLGENEKAGDAFKTSLFKGNSDQGVITNMKNSYEAAGKPELVKQAYIDIKAQNPAQTLAMDKKLYFIYTKEKDWDNTIACCRTILSDPEIDEANQLKYLKASAQAFLNINQADSASVYYDKVLAITPNDPDIHKALGYGLYNTIQRVTANAQAKYNANKTNLEFANMQTAIKKATLNYGPKAIEHLRIANQTLNDKNITDMIARLQNNINSYNKK